MCDEQKAQRLQVVYDPPLELLDIDVRRLRLLPGDYVCITSKVPLPPLAHQRINELCAGAFPDNKVLVLDHPLDIVVLSAEDGARQALQQEHGA